MIIHNPKELAAIVRSHRKSQKISQSRVCDLVGLKQTTISAFENRPEATKLDTLFRILAAANLEIQLLPKNADNDQSGWSEEW